MVSRLAARLSQARHRRFAGRTAEKSLFRAALAAAELPFFLLYIFGPGGVGKTTLLSELAYLSEQAKIPALLLDARNIDPSPEAFLSALQLALGLTPPDSPLPALTRRNQRQVILIDTYEKLGPLDAWLRELFLPELPADTLVVVAGQNPLSLGWLADPGWQSLVRVAPLRNLHPEESRDYLSRREVPPEQHQAILDFTYGYPLALSLIADVFAQRQDILRPFKPEAAPDIVKILLEQLVQKVPGPAHRAALEACALVYLTTEALLAAILAIPDVHELFEWLRGLSCIESGPFGLFPHDLAREALTADLRWRNPDWYAELHNRARKYYAARLQQTQGQEQQAILAQYIFLHRDNPVVRPFFTQLQAHGSEASGLMADIGREWDWPLLVELVKHFEGQATAQIAAHWFARQPEQVQVLRNAEHQPVGLLFLLALDRATPADLAADPVAQAAKQFLDHSAPLRPGEKATMFRFWMGRESYQNVSSVQGHIFISMVQHYLTTPALAFTFLPCTNPDFWQPIFAYADLARLTELDYTLNGQPYGVYGHDWRVVPPITWLDLLAQREISTAPQPAPPPLRPTMMVLSQPEFENAIRNLLRDFRVTRPDALRYNPLLWSRLVTEQAGANADETKRATALQTLVKEAAAKLQASPRQNKFYQALYHTYFHPAPTQEQAAELLDLPFSTYRRHLKTGVEQLTHMLWQREIGGLER
jgi:hypothetical protein